jgi:hypothetical protein
MVNELLQSVAFRCVFKAYLSGTNTPATGKTIAVVLSKNGGSFANPSAGATNATEIANGWYYVDGSTTDSGTLGDLVVRGTEGTIDPAERLFRIVKATNRGATALPDAAATAAGGLPVSAAGSLNLDARLDAAVSSRMASYTQPAGFLAATFPSDPADHSLVIAATDAIVTAIGALNNLSSGQAQSAAAAALTTYGGPTNVQMEARTLVAASYATAANQTTILSKTNLIPASPAAVGSAMTLADGAITEAKISTPAEAAGRPTGILGMVRRIFEWRTNKRVRTRSTGALELRNEADDATLETQTQSTAGGVGSEVDTQTKGV